MLNILVIASIICWGVCGIFEKQAVEKSSSNAVLLVLYSFSLPIAAFTFWLLNGSHPGWSFPLNQLGWPICAALAQYAAGICYLRAMSKTDASVVLGITAAYPAVMQVLSVFLLGEHLVPARFIGGSLITLGVLFIGSSCKFSQDMFGKQTATVLGWVLVTTFLWGIIGILDKQSVAAAGALGAYCAKSCCNVLLLVATLMWRGWRNSCEPLSNKALWSYASPAALLLAIGTLSYLQAMALAPASYVIVITGCYPIVMYVCALVFLKERLNFRRLSGVLTVVLGGLLTQLSQTL